MDYSESLVMEKLQAKGYEVKEVPRWRGYGGRSLSDLKPRTRLKYAAFDLLIRRKGGRRQLWKPVEVKYTSSGSDEIMTTLRQMKSVADAAGFYAISVDRKEVYLFKVQFKARIL